jgi:hypothetical protein
MVFIATLFLMEKKVGGSNIICVMEHFTTDQYTVDVGSMYYNDAVVAGGPENIFMSEQMGHPTYARCARCGDFDPGLRPHHPMRRLRVDERENKMAIQGPLVHCNKEAAAPKEVSITFLALIFVFFVFLALAAAKFVYEIIAVKATTIE